MRGSALLASLLLFWTAPSLAQPAPISVQLAPCANGTTLDLAALLELLRSELAPRELQVVGPGAAHDLAIDACQVDTLLIQAGGDPPRESTLALDDVSAALRPRVAALVAAELVAPPEHSAPAASTEASATAPAPPTPSEPPVEPAPVLLTARALSQPAPTAPARADLDPDLPPADAPVGRLVVGAETRLFLSVTSFYVGPRAIFMMKRLELSLLALFARQQDELGVIRTGLAAATLQVPIWRLRRERAELAVAVGAELGASWGGGTPDSSYATTGASQVGPFAALPVSLAWGGAPRHSAYLRVELGLGYAYGMNSMAGGEVLATTHGPFALLSAQIGTRAAPR
jgi:hypothetical protein